MCSQCSIMHTVAIGCVTGSHKAFCVRLIDLVLDTISF